MKKADPIPKKRRTSVVPLSFLVFLVEADENHEHVGHRYATGTRQAAKLSPELPRDTDMPTLQGLTIRLVFPGDTVEHRKASLGAVEAGFPEQVSKICYNGATLGIAPLQISFDSGRYQKCAGWFCR